MGDLLDVVSIEAGQFGITAEPVDLRAVIHESIDAFQPTAAAREIRLEAPAAGERFPARFDHGRVLQVMANLLSNAIKFSPRGSAVKVAASLVGANVEVSVTDDGPGIAPEQLKAVFERFWQASPGDRRGLGLGLFISRRIVEAHGGKIWVEPLPTRGSRFCFTLPTVTPTV